MKKYLSLLLVSCLVVVQVNSSFAASDRVIPDSHIQTINHNIEARVYAYKKKKHYTAVEIGFTNLTGKYVAFTPKEIYLDDEVKYSQGLLTMDEIRSIESKKPGLSLFPTAIAVAMGIAAVGTSRANSGAAFGLAMGALGMGGLALLTKGLEERAKQNKFIAFENNTFHDIKRLPPGMTLGGVLYFPPTKKPKSITIISRSASGKYEKKVFYLRGIKKK
jgi:ATP:corrinoid adenosyltransferase